MNDPVHAYLFALVDDVEARMPKVKPSMVVVCLSCHGDGLADDEYSKCPTCGGSGRRATAGGEV
jgi:DnaJ-class molecular chaperone